MIRLPGSVYRLPMHATFTAELFEWPEGSWFFVALPEEVSDEILDSVPGTNGFGSVPVEATLEPTTWRTSLFPDKARGTFVLPVKKAVRSAAGVGDGDLVDVHLTVLPEMIRS